MSKLCTECKLYQQYSEFYRNDGTDDGYSTKCKSCTTAYAKARRQNTKTRAAILASDRARNSTLRRRAQRGLYKQTELEKYPEKTIARREVAKALRSGVLTKQVCEVCGEEKVEAHHEDYSKYLDVNWLCKTHHTLADKKRQERINN